MVVRGFARIGAATAGVVVGVVAGVVVPARAPAASEVPEPLVVTTVSSTVPPLNVGLTVTATALCPRATTGAATLVWVVRDAITDEVIASAPYELAEKTPSPDGSMLAASHTLAPESLTVGTAYRVYTSGRGADCFDRAVSFTRSADVLVVGAPAASAPQPPTRVLTVAHDGQVTVSWDAPTADGGSPITGYGATAAPGGAVCLATETTCTVTGLANGTRYTFAVTAWNAAGTSVPSVPSAPVAPFGLPGTPTGIAGAAGDEMALVPWNAPESDGGSPITGYVVTASPGDAACISPTPGCFVTDLENGTAYTFTVTAVNAVGAGAPSAPSEVVTPFAAPGTPTSVTGVAADQAVDVSWTEPASDGGSPITGYVVTASPGGATCAAATTSCTVTGLTNGTAYTFTVTATNADGPSAASDPSEPVTPQAAAPPPVVEPLMELVLDYGVGTSLADARVTAQGRGAMSGAPLAITVYSSPQVIGASVVPTDGAFSLSASLPTELEAGLHTIVAATQAADGSPLEQSATFVVDENGVIVVSDDGLATTGSDAGGPVVSAVALVVVGLGLIGARRVGRRRPDVVDAA